MLSGDSPVRKKVKPGPWRPLRKPGRGVTPSGKEGLWKRHFCAPEGRNKLTIAGHGLYRTENGWEVVAGRLPEKPFQGRSTKKTQRKTLPYRLGDSESFRVDKSSPYKTGMKGLEIRAILFAMLNDKVRATWLKEKRGVGKGGESEEGVFIKRES